MQQDAGIEAYLLHLHPDTHRQVNLCSDKLESLPRESPQQNNPPVSREHTVVYQACHFEDAVAVVESSRRVVIAAEVRGAGHSMSYSPRLIEIRVTDKQDGLIRSFTVWLFRSVMEMRAKLWQVRDHRLDVKINRRFAIFLDGANRWRYEAYSDACTGLTKRSEPHLGIVSGLWQRKEQLCLASSRVSVALVGRSKGGCRC